MKLYSKFFQMSHMHVVHIFCGTISLQFCWTAACHWLLIPCWCSYHGPQGRCQRCNSCVWPLGVVDSLQLMLWEMENLGEWWDKLFFKHVFFRMYDYQCICFMCFLFLIFNSFSLKITYYICVCVFSPPFGWWERFVDFDQPKEAGLPWSVVVILNTCLLWI